MAGGTRTDPVLITGCSSGIGRAAAVGLHHAGLRVYATARRPDTLARVPRDDASRDRRMTPRLLRLRGDLDLAAHLGSRGSDVALQVLSEWSRGGSNP